MKVVDLGVELNTESFQLMKTIKISIPMELVQHDSNGISREELTRTIGEGILCAFEKMQSLKETE